MNAIPRVIRPAVLGTILVTCVVSMGATITDSAPERAIGIWSICSSALSPDGNHLAIGATFGKIKVWDLLTAKETTLNDGPGSDVVSVAYSPDGTKILTSNGSLWDVTTGKMIKSYRFASGPLVFSHDGTKIIAPAFANDGTCRMFLLLNAVTGDTIRSFKNDCSYVNSSLAEAAFSLDDSKILSATNHNFNNGDHAWFVDVWNVATGTVIRSVEYGVSVYNYYSAAISVAFSPDNVHFAAALYEDTNSTVDVFDLTKDSSDVALRGVKGNVYTMTFSPDGSKLLTGSSTGKLCLWNPLTGDSIGSFRANLGRVLSASFLPGGTRILATGSGTSSAMWNVATGDTCGTFQEPTWFLLTNMMSLAISPDGSKILAGMKYGSITKWDVATGNAVFDFLDTCSVGHNVYSLAYSPDGSKVVAGGDSGAVKLWDLMAKTETAIVAPGKAIISSVAFLPDGSAFLTASRDSSVRLWNATTGALMRTYVSNDMYANTVTVSPDGSTMWVGYSAGSRVRLWNIATGDSLLCVSPGYQINKLAISPDGSKLVAAADFCTYLLDGYTGATLSRVDSGGYVSSVAFSHDGTKFVVGVENSQGSLWDAASGRCLRRFTGFSMEDALFSPNDSMVISRDLAHILLWDISNSNASIRSKRAPVTSNRIALLSARRHTLSFFFPPGIQLSHASSLSLYQSSGRCIKSFSLRHAAGNGLLTIALPQGMGTGIYIFRFSGIGVSQPSGSFAIVK